jgi:hypothetical protein
MDALTYLQAIAPDLASNPSVSVFIDMASQEIDAGLFGASYQLALAYLVAHKMTLFLNSARAGGTTGNITSKSEGSLSVAFGGVKGGGISASLAQTSYGVEFNRLLNTRTTAGIFVTGGNDVGY